MDNKVIVISESKFYNLLNPLVKRLDKIESLLSQYSSSVNSVYSNIQAAKYLNLSTKKYSIFEMIERLDLSVKMEVEKSPTNMNTS